MTEGGVVHSSFTLERTFTVPVDVVWRAWTDRDRKATWFAPDAERYVLDARVGGVERLEASGARSVLVFESRYVDVVDRARLAYSSLLTTDGRPATLSITTVEFDEDDAGATVLITEQGAFLDGLEYPDWRRAGTEKWLVALGHFLGVTDD